MSVSGKNRILGLKEYEFLNIFFYTYEHLKFHDQLSSAWKKFYNLGARCETDATTSLIHIYVCL